MDNFNKNYKSLISGKKNFWNVYVNGMKNTFSKKTFLFGIGKFTLIFIISVIIFHPYLLEPHSYYNLSLIYSVVEKCSTISVAIFAIVFTCYSIYTSFLSDKVINFLLSVSDPNDSKGTSFYEVYDDFFFTYMCNFFFFMFISIFLMIILYVFKDYNICSSRYTLMNVLSFLFYIYTTVFFILFWNIKSLIYNSFTVFTAASSYSAKIYHDSQIVHYDGKKEGHP